MMYKTIQVVMILLCVIGCSDKTNKKTKNTIAINILEIDYPVDSLLKFNAEKELKAVFGKYVERGEGRYPEALGTYNNTLLFPRTKNQVEFIWQDDTLNFEKLVSLKIIGKHTDWKTKEGITIGTTIIQLESFNKKPFTFYGLEWDYSGDIQWNNGYLEERKIYGSLDYPDQIMPKEFDSLIGDHTIKSSSEIAKKANLIFSELVMLKK